MVQYILMTYSNSIGDIKGLDYNYWLQKQDGQEITYPQQVVIQVVVWSIWFVNQLINMIILLNFLIAVISEVHADVTAERQMHSFRYMAQLNREVYQLKKFFKLTRAYQIIAFQFDKELDEYKESELDQVVAKISNFVKE